jgi:hypothetical protein
MAQVPSRLDAGPCCHRVKGHPGNAGQAPTKAHVAKERENRAVFPSEEEVQARLASMPTLYSREEMNSLIVETMAFLR